MAQEGSNAITRQESGGWEDRTFTDYETPLNQEEREEAELRLAIKHPLEIYPVSKVYPMCGWLCCCCRGEAKQKKLSKLLPEEFNENDNNLDAKLKEFNMYPFTGKGYDDKESELLRKAFVDENNPEFMKQYFNHKVKGEEDIYDQLGYGFTAYFRMLWSYMCLFFVFTILLGPTFYIYYSHGGMKEAAKVQVLSLGNMGFTGSFCVNQYVGHWQNKTASMNTTWAFEPMENSRKFQCETGHIDSLEYIGIIPAMKAPEYEPEGENRLWINSKYQQSAFCGDDSGSVAQALDAKNFTQDPGYGIQECTRATLNTTKYEETFNSTCIGIGTDNYKNIGSCALPNIFAPEFQMPGQNSTVMTNCVQGDQPTSLEAKEFRGYNPARFYLQIKCKQDDAAVINKRVEGLLVSCTFVLIAIVFWIFNYYLNRTSKLNFKKWDINSITAADFTVEYAVTESIWQEYKRVIDAEQGHAEAHNEYCLREFSAYLTREIERRVKAVPWVINAQEQQLGIAKISYAFDNSNLIGQLTKRGTLISSGKLDKLKEVNEELKDLYTFKKESLIKPVRAYITFTTQEGFERAGLYWPMKRDDVPEPVLQLVQPQENESLLNCYLKLEKATEPGNIIWEHLESDEISWYSGRGCTKTQWLCKVFVFVMIGLFVAAMFGFFAWVKIESVTIQKQFPPSFDCPALDEMFEGNATAYLQMAAIDKNYTLNFFGTGQYQCYCAQLKLKKGADYVNLISQEDKNLCSVYNNLKFDSYLLGNAISFMITAVNFIIRAINIKLVGCIQYHTKSQETEAITISIFVATFLNTAFLLLLSQANLQYNGLSFLGLNGSYVDMTENWYLNIGPSLVSTMMINSVYIWLDFGISYGTKTIFRLLDKKCKCCKVANPDGTKYYPSKATTISQYVNLYSGPNHLMHFKYASILTTVYVTFMFGAALPILFPIAVFTFFNMYVAERTLLAYYYPKPPTYDDQLNNLALRTTKWAPIFLIFFGFWFLGQPQIFNNFAEDMQFSFNVTLTGHTVDPIIGPDLPLFIAGILFATVMLLNVFGIFNYLMKCVGLMEMMEDVDVNENLGTYFECIPAWTRKSMVCEEAHLRKTLKSKAFSNDNYDACRGAIQKGDKDKEGNDNNMEAPENYEILNNPIYQERFQFTDIHFRNSQFEDDIVKIILFMIYQGYVKEGQTDRTIGIDWNRDIAQMIKENQKEHAKKLHDMKNKRQMDRNGNRDHV